MNEERKRKSREYHREYQRKWIKENPEKIKEYRRRQKEKKKPRISRIYEKVCEECNQVFYVRMKQQKFCNKECRIKFFNKRYLDKKRPERKCINCHKLFIPSTKKSYCCSRTCSSCWTTVSEEELEKKVWTWELDLQTEKWTDLRTGEILEDDSE